MIIIIILKLVFLDVFLDELGVIIIVYYINTNEIPSELSRENLISSHVKTICYHSCTYMLKLLWWTNLGIKDLNEPDFRWVHKWPKVNVVHALTEATFIS